MLRRYITWNCKKTTFFSRRYLHNISNSDKENLDIENPDIENLENVLRSVADSSWYTL